MKKLLWFVGGYLAIGIFFAYVLPTIRGLPRSGFEGLLVIAWPIALLKKFK